MKIKIPHIQFNIQIMKPGGVIKKQTKQREAVWYYGNDGKLHCSVCEKVPATKIMLHGRTIFQIEDIKEIMEYCPRCGAKII